MTSLRPVIVLLTDFGLADWFVGSMKAAILARMPDCTIVDLCHAIEPGRVAQGAWVLGKTFRELPPGAIFCAVVDPGVGGARRAIVSEADGWLFAAPDNGLLSGVWRQATAWHCRALTNEAWMAPRRSATFHGRDVFAPAAAVLALEGAIQFAGDPLRDPVVIELPSARVRDDGAVEGEIVYFDRFGNALTSIDRAALEALGPGGGGAWRVTVGQWTVEGLARTFADAAPGEGVAYWGSVDALEIAVRDGNARQRFGLTLGQPVRLLPAGRS